MTAKVHVAYKFKSGAVLIPCHSMKKNSISPNCVTAQAFDNLQDNDKCAHCARDLARRREQIARRKANAA